MTDTENYQDKTDNKTILKESELPTKLTNEELYKIVDEVEKEEKENTPPINKNISVSVGLITINKKQSFIKNLFTSTYRKKINNQTAMKRKLRKLAGINLDPTIARLKLKDNIVVNFTEIPPWYDIIRYKLCGFEYEVVVKL